ncbi:MULTISPECIES: acyl-CoA synthetase FdrA [Caballeronia]|uniref:acyl-CoA synthetase FdrA n=1 Tax=Caballeronia TaxID=1827195 RepID=UPI0015889AF3|nr:MULTISPECIES: acyl-CoA synthetase FdrA [Caballeronia]MCG7405376.1 acyl-CoA synthetase FdrA [Caballeronia zhejiangensis]MCI1047238.1 acyl-CoA synthetase FdrA [Caballeronia zhejiangensis]
MAIKIEIFKNLYQDSVSLMQISAHIGKLPGVEQASVVMGTPANLVQLADAGLGDDVKASPNDLVIAVRGDEAACEEALGLARERLSARVSTSDTQTSEALKATSLAMVCDDEPASNLALISVPGDYAAAEAIKALQFGMNVMLFSDNVSMAHEKAIKTFAREKRLIVMGPDCGTAIVNGMPLGFANVVRRGGIGVVGASGTGLQEVTCRIDQLGAGISQALGTGGHDLHEDIGGISMQFGLDALAEDPDTRVIVLISKPPARAVAERILESARKAGKPVVVNFLGASEDEMRAPGLTPAHTLADAAQFAVALLNGAPLPASVARVEANDEATLVKRSETLGAGRKFIRGVFAGGTFCYESQLLCKAEGFMASSNTPVKGNAKLADIWKSEGHTIVDMGDDDFTRGRPHPMIDPTLRDERVRAEMLDPATAVVLFDLVLGYGAADEPAQGLIALLAQLPRENAPLLIAHVCGTESDPQVRSRQIDALREAGVLVAGCNAEAALWASRVARLQARRHA